jgi:aminoglycoside 6'-N-acetyltransferase I
MLKAGNAFDVRPAVPDDAGVWLEMRRSLWPEDGPDTHAGEIDQYFAGLLNMPLEVLIAFDARRRALGFVELSIRTYAEDCVTDRVAYLEGWYVVPDRRRLGVGRALIAAAENWGRAQGCTEFGSDALLDNDISARAHQALGFEETARIRCFKKLL